MLVPDHSPYPWYFLIFPNNLGMSVSTTQTVISWITNAVFQCFSGTQVHQAKTLPKLLQGLVDGSRPPSYNKPVITCPRLGPIHRVHRSHGRRHRAQQKHFSQTQQSFLFTKLRQEKTRGALLPQWYFDFCDALTHPVLPPSRFVLSTSIT